MRAVARSFDLDSSYFDTLFDDRSLGGCGTVATLRLNFYPQNENQTPVSIGVDDGQPLSCEAHCDGSVLTILYQHEVGGLQVKMEDGTWFDVPVVPYGLVVNTGKCLERWTNGCFKAISHRVKLLKEERLSVPFFLEPCYSTLIIPLPTAGGQPKYEPIKYGEYIIESNKQFKEYQRDEDKP
jgi:isopenicillin N synthase-like dioxygenase